MGSRYGRNKRRRHREQVATLQDMLLKRSAYLDEVLRRSRQQAQHIERLKRIFADWDAEIRAFLGPYTSFAINDTTFRVDHPDRVRQMPVMPPLPNLLACPPDHVPEMIEYHAVTMLSFIMGMAEEDLNRMRRLLTMRIQVGGDRPLDSAYYAMSEKAWQELKHAGPDAMRRMIYRVAEDMLKLVSQPKQQRKTG